MKKRKNVVKTVGLAIFLFLTVFSYHVGAVNYEIIVDEHDRPLPIPIIGWYYNCTGGDRGLLNVGPASYSWDGNSSYTATVIFNPGSWTHGGMWYSLIRTDNDNIPLDFKAIFGPYVKPAYQGEITEVAIVVNNVNSPTNNTSLKLRLELKNTSNVLISSQTWTNLLAESYPTTFTWILAESDKQEVEIVSWVMDYAQVGDSVSVDAVKLKASVPNLPPEEQAFLWTYSWLMTNYDPVTGMVQDRSNFDLGDDENVTATAKTAKIIYYATRKGYTASTDAETVITKIAETLSDVVTTGPVGINSLWAHFTCNGGTQIKPNTEWASGDTAFAALDIITALELIGDPQNQISDLENFLETINWSALLINGGISHGYSYNGSLKTSFWQGFGMETMGVNWAYASATGNFIEMGPPPSDNGSGFIDNAHYPIVFSGIDRWGNNWDFYRSNMADTQIGWYCLPPHDNVYLCNPGLFGLSAGENPEATTYTTYGIVGKYAGPEDGNAEVIVLHYSGMIADIRPSQAIGVWETLRDRSPAFLQNRVVISPLNNLESLRVDKTTGKLTINHLKGSWNLALQAEGWALKDPVIKADLLTTIQQNDFLKRGYDLLKAQTSSVQCWQMY